eukprot:TRINITY_DN75983_c0_g1_i1.p1 TRINITY_DN75983_c0_g1~~TRINITY_DN75983_c0_g1_i1.p1  ORF type:complete len:209 (-),score=28.11 TRINITY_DN75983_c0_g1_i1:21-647(-)
MVSKGFHCSSLTDHDAWWPATSRFSPASVETSFADEKTNEGIARLGEANDLVKSWTVDLNEIHDKVQGIRDAALAVGELNNKLKSLESHLLDAIDDAELLVGLHTGLGPLAESIAKIKAKAAQQQYELGLAKVAVDNLVPGQRGMNYGAMAFCAAAPCSQHTLSAPRCRTGRIAPNGRDGNSTTSPKGGSNARQARVDARAFVHSAFL